MSATGSPLPVSWRSGRRYRRGQQCRFGRQALVLARAGETLAFRPMHASPLGRRTCLLLASCETRGALVSRPAFRCPRCSQIRRIARGPPSCRQRFPWSPAPDNNRLQDRRSDSVLGCFDGGSGGDRSWRWQYLGLWEAGRLRERVPQVNGGVGSPRTPALGHVCDGSRVIGGVEPLECLSHS